MIDTRDTMPAMSDDIGWARVYLEEWRACADDPTKPEWLRSYARHQVDQWTSLAAQLEAQQRTEA